MSGPIGASSWMYGIEPSFYEYTIDQSLRFEDGDQPGLTKTFSTTQTNTKIITVSVWVKRGNLGRRNSIMFAKSGSSGWFTFNTDDKLYWNPYNTGYNGFKSTRVFRDPSAWYHIVATADSDTQSGANIYNVYVNGEQLTNSDGSTHVPDNTATKILANGLTTYIGDDTDASTYHHDGYLAEMHVIDGSVVAYTEFGETKNGVWIPKEYNGSYGTNGFYLSFSNSSAIGDDLSGNNNDFTANNLVASDVVSDSPTNSFCTLNPLTAGTYPTLKEGNLSIATAYSADLCGVTSTWYPTTGKWYWEIHAEGSTLTYPYFGITDQRYTNYNATTGSYYNIAWNRTGTAASLSGFMGTITKENATSWTNNDIIMFALDVDARKLWIGKNGTWNDSGDPAAGTGENASWTLDTGVSPLWMGYQSQGVNSVFNFGQDGTFNGNQTAQGNADENGVGDFYYSPPSGFLAMATSNIEDGNIGPNSDTQATDHFDVKLWSADVSNPAAGDKQISLDFRPDLVWSKNRNNAENHYWMDSVRGDNVGNKWLRANSTAAEGADAVGSTTAKYDFTPSGFDIIDTNSGSGEVYYNSRTYVGWCWKAGTSVSGTTTGSGTGQSYTGSVNTDAGLSIIAYTGNGTAGHTIPHHLGVAPKMVITKKRSSTGSWGTYHAGLTSASYYILLNDSAAQASNNVYFNGTAPTNSVVTRGTGADGNANGVTYIQYAFAEIEGYSKIGSYIGNFNANGPFIFTGFRPAWVMLKRIDSADSWLMRDNKRDPYNVTAQMINANANGAEYTDSTLIDFVSNGFKLRHQNSLMNASGGTFIYLAFAEAPFKYSNAR